jgi:serine/threonine protein kinase
MVTIKGYIEIAPNQLESKVFHCIDQRDIKLDNLLIDQDICLKNINFDIAMRVEDEDEEVDDQCGTGLKRNRSIDLT